MSSIYVELKISNTSRTVDGSSKSGNTYTFYVKESFDVKSKNDLLDLVKELNYQLGKDGISPVELRGDVETDLRRLSLGGRGLVRIN